MELCIFFFRKASLNLTIISKLIISIDRRCSPISAEETTAMAIEFFKSYPDVVVGIELSGDPTTGSFDDFVPALNKARKAGLKVCEYTIKALFIPVETTPMRL